MSYTIRHTTPPRAAVVREATGPEGKPRAGSHPGNSPERPHGPTRAVRFPLGRILVTPGALRALDEAGQSLLTFLARHAAGDWGDLDAHDCAANEYAVTSGERILSAYRLASGTRVWIITEADRSATTALLPDEY